MIHYDYLYIITKEQLSNHRSIFKIFNFKLFCIQKAWRPLQENFKTFLCYQHLPPSTANFSRRRAFHESYPFIMTTFTLHNHPTIQLLNKLHNESQRLSRRTSGVPQVVFRKLRYSNAICYKMLRDLTLKRCLALVSCFAKK
jgi:hypothetical protein